MSARNFSVQVRHGFGFEASWEVVGSGLTVSEAREAMDAVVARSGEYPANAVRYGYTSELLGFVPRDMVELRIPR